MTTIKSAMNFRVDNVDTLNTHVMQVMTGKPLCVQPLTAHALSVMVGLRFEDNYAKSGAEFTMVDGEGITVATFNKAMRSRLSLENFLKTRVELPTIASFDHCDKVIKCAKTHQQSISYARMPAHNYTFGGYSRICPIPVIVDKVAKQGYCISTLLLSLSYHVPASFDSEFSDVIEQVIKITGSWPTLELVSKICQWIILRVPVLAAAPIPMMACNHETKLIHICDQRGMPTRWHQLKMGTLVELANACEMGASTLLPYKVGGTEIEEDDMLYLRGLSKVKINLKRWVFNGGFLEDCATDVHLAAFIMLSPVLLSKLKNLINQDDELATKLVTLEANCKNKLVVATALKTAVQGVLVHANTTRLENIWTHINELLRDQLNEEGRDFNAQLSRALHRLHAHMLSEKKNIIAYERRLYALTQEQFKREFGCLSGWESKCRYILRIKRQEVDVGKQSISLRALDDGISRKTLEYVNQLFINTALSCLCFCNTCYTIMHFAFVVGMTIFGCMSVTKLILMCFKGYVMRRMAHNWERLMLITTIFIVYELARFIMKQKEKRALTKQKEGEELQAGPKSSERQMMAAMAMMTLAVHAFDMDLAITMSSALNHVGRLANMLTDTTAGWLVGGTGTEELQMKIFDVALEVDKQEQVKNEMEAASSSAIGTFSAWVNENIITGNDSTRPLCYGSNDSVYELNSTNGADIGKAMTKTGKAWSHVVGMTGSGKSTRVPLGYYSALQNIAGRRRNILICEPTQVTTRNVADALSFYHGKAVYYKHEDKERVGDMSIQVMTYGSAFFRSVNNPDFLDNFDAVFLDESHLITAHSLSLESLLNKYTTVRKFYLSATPRNGIQISAMKRRFEIFEHPAEQCDVDHFIHQLRKGSNVDPMAFGSKVLVFVAGKNEADKASHSVNSTKLGITAYSLHRDNFKTNYEKITTSLDQPNDVIIFATNVLETGVTLNVDVVVDFGYTNTPVLDLTAKTFLLHRRRVTRAERKQRIGRAGRLRDGHAIVLGKVGEPTEVVPADVVYEAALLSFVYNLDVYVNSHFDHVWIGNVTRQQAKTMLNFRIPSFAMKDVVFPDGSVRSELLACLKSRTMRSGTIKTVEGCTVSHVYESWPKIGAYCQKFGIPLDSEAYSRVSRRCVPFIFHEMGSLDLEAYSNAIQTYKPCAITRWAKPVKETVSTIMHVSKQNINETMYVARALRQSTESFIATKRQAQTLHRESPMACLFTKSSLFELETKLGNQIKLGERNLEKITAFISQLELFANLEEVREEDLEITPEGLENIGKILELQMDTTCNEKHVNEVLHLEDLPKTTFNEAIIIGRKRAAFAFALTCIAAFGGLAWYYLWDDDEGLNNTWNKGNRKAVLKDVLEMKGKSFNRDKRSSAAYEHILSQDYNVDTEHDLDVFRSQKARKKKEPKTAFENLMSKKSPFITMYDITSDENVVNAVFMDVNNQAFYETGNPLAHMEDVRKHFLQHQEERETITWGASMDDDIYCHVTTRDGTELRILLTPHASTRGTRTSGKQGYAAHDGHYRQTGQAEILKQPTQVLEVDTRMPDSKIDVSVSNMIGLATLAEGRTNCILYKDWIILPAHAMMSSLPMSLQFKHYTCTINELPECYSFPGFDLLLVRKPRTLQPVRCSATLDHAKDGVVVQMLYKKPGIEKLLMTITAEAYRTRDLRWEHQIPTAIGMCGCPVFDVATGKIIGIHIKGDTKKMCNTFEAFPGDAMKLLDSNDKKIVNLYNSNRIKSWSFTPEMHGHDSSKIKNLQSENVIFSKFSRDTDVYTVENILRSASGGGLFKPREVMQARALPPLVSAPHMKNLAYANGMLNTRHIFEGENPYWKQFKLCMPEVVDVVSKYEDKYLPSALNKEAYWKDLLKYNRPLHDVKVNQDALHAATRQLIKVLKESGLRETRIMTSDEVLQDIQWGKAAGPLYGMKKRELCERSGLNMESLTALAIHCRSELRKGRNAGVWNGSLKAELRPKEKVEMNKTRVFTAAPITTLIGAKFYVDDFNKQFYATHLKAPHTVGINKFQNGWAKVHKKLDVPGWLHGSGDGSRFDSSIDPFLFDIIYTIRCHFMREEDKREAGMAMSHMFREFVFTPIHTIGGNILMKRVGNNSGQPSTVVDNTLVLMISFYYAYAVKTGDLNFEHIENRFRFVCNGDDNKFSVSPEFVKEFGGTFTEEISQLGLTYEFDDLTPDITRNPYMSLTMIPVGGKIGFQLNPERIIAIAQWIKKGGVVHATQAAFAAMVESLNDPVLFLILHRYFVWLLVENYDVLVYARDNDLGSFCYMDPCQVYALHYGEASTLSGYDFSDNESDCDDDDERTIELQMDAEQLKAQAEAEKLAKQEEDKAKEKKEEGEGHHTVKSTVESGGPSEQPNSKNGDDVEGPTGDPQDEEGDIAWVMPKLSPLIGTALIPSVNGKRLWKRGILKNIPDAQYRVASNEASHNQLTMWVQGVKDNLKIKDDRTWNVVITAWCIWCANNGTSPELDTSQELEIHDAFGKVQSVRIGAFVDPAVKSCGLRKIMRHFSGPTQETLEAGGTMTQWGLKRGFTERRMIPYAFDFCVVNNRTPKTVREQLAQAKVAAIGTGTTRKMVLDGSIHGAHSSYERHMDTDSSEYEHGIHDDRQPDLI